MACEDSFSLAGVRRRGIRWSNGVPETYRQAGAVIMIRYPALYGGAHRSLALAFFCTVIARFWLQAGAPSQVHPLDPLTTNELAAASEILRNYEKANTNCLYPLLALKEPSKEEVLGSATGIPFRREAFAVVFDRRANKTFEAVVDLSARKVSSWKHVPDVQPMWTSPEDSEATEVVRNNPQWQAAMRRRDITNFSDVMISNFAPGHHGHPGREGGRFYRAVFNFRGRQKNVFGPPIEGVEVLVDLSQGKVIQVIDTGVRPLAKESTDFFDARVRGSSRPPLKPLRLSAPEGSSFVIDGNEVRWDRWRFRYGFHPREGLVLHLVRYEDEGMERPVLYRASISEMLVPYGDPDRTWFWRNAVDAGEYGLGKCSVPLMVGQNTPTHATLLDVAMTDDLGESELWQRRIDIFEREGDTLWTHWDYVNRVTEGRRARELVIGFLATIGNYDYRFQWIFRQDASIEFVTELTGIILTKGVAIEQCEVCRQRPKRGGIVEPKGPDRFGTLVAPYTVGVNHQHFINMRLDFDIDGISNAVKEINVRPTSDRRSNPHGNAFRATQTVFGKERDSTRDINLASHRTWAVFNPNQTTSLGHHPAYGLEPHGNVVPFLSRESRVRKATGFVDHHFFATRYRESEQYAAGPYPFYSRKHTNVLTWINNNESILNQDVVVWYTFGITHITRPEDFPIMPAARAGFKLIPKGFFNRNPAMDVPPTAQEVRTSGTTNGFR